MSEDIGDVCNKEQRDSFHMGDNIRLSSLMTLGGVPFMKGIVGGMKYSLGKNKGALKHITAATTAGYVFLNSLGDCDSGKECIESMMEMAAGAALHTVPLAVGTSVGMAIGEGINYFK
ncbi:hypothetical protein ACFL96_18525 [Thermoproteota archaeon]